MTSHPLRRTALLVVAVAASLLVVPPTAGAGGHPPTAPGAVADTGADQGAPTYHSSGLAPTPYLGWNTYYGLGAGSEAQVRSVADFLASSGMRDAGYRYVWLDGGWQATPPRDAHGNLTADPTRYPDGIPSLVTYLHGLGLKVGIYTDAGSYDPAHCGLGSGGHYQADANLFAAWKMDAVKMDFLCGIAQHLDPATVYARFSAAVADTGRPMVLNLCDPVTSGWGDYPFSEQAGNAYSYGPLLADSWRTDTDIAFGDPTAGEWADVLRNMDDNAAHPEANGPGHYNDPDYLIPMRHLSDGSLELTQEESTTQLVMWAEMASPLIVGSDPRTLPRAMIDTLDNPEIVGVDQDPLDVQGVRVASSATGDVYSKVLSGTGRRAVVLLNRSASAASMTVTFANAGLSGPVSVRDLRARADVSRFTGSYTTTVPAHGTAFLALTGTELAPGTDLGGGATTSPALVRFDDTRAAAFTRSASGALAESTLTGSAWSTSWTALGGPTHGQILGQPAAYGSAGGRIDVFVRGTDDHAYQRTFSGTGWGGWTDLGGTPTDAPTVAFTSPTSWTVFARGADGQVWARGAHTGWTSVGAPGGRPIYGRPSAVTDANGTYVAVRTADDQVWWRTSDPGGTWSAWTALGGVVSGSPTLLATEGRVYLFARASDYTIWQRNFVAGAWGGWFPRGEFASNAVTGALGTAAGANGSAWVALRGPDGHVRQTVL
jgi:alpha-galactosidase